MKKSLLLLSAFGYSYLGFGQYCVSGGPSSTADSNVGSVVLNGSPTSINFVGCPGVVGVQDLTFSQTANLNAGGNYTVSVQFSTCGGNFSGAGEVWIDYNIDGVFDPSESLGTWSGIPPVPVSNFNFTVPLNALTGNTRMRVIQQEAGILPLDPCANFTWGSVMDFSITIGGGIDCSSYDGDVMADAIPVTTIPYSTTGDNSFCYFNQNFVYSSPDIYYRVIPTADIAELHVSLCGSGFDTFLSVIEPDGTVIAYNDDGSCGSSSEVTFSTEGIDTAFIIVEGWGNESGNFNLEINAEYLDVTELSDNLFTLSPNPATDIITIQGTTNATIELIDVRGSILAIYTDYQGESLNLSFLENGIYYARITEGSLSKTLQFVKQ
ncbi:MAG: T9SS type A sorting domain-containing protein [Bacteroidota bacterium]